MNEFADTRLPVSEDDRTLRTTNVAGNIRDREQEPATLRGETIRQNFVDAMRVAVSGVNLVTTDGLAGRFGQTVSAMCSVSADPPMLLACINSKSPMCDAILVNRHFCVNVLSIYQNYLARIFAGVADSGSAYDFNAADWEVGPTNVPRLIDAVSTFDCVLEDALEKGSHRIFIARVTAATANEGTPLLYTSRSYGFPLTWN